MADLDMQPQARNLSQVRYDLRRSAHVQRAKQMLVAAGLAALSVIATAAAFLSQVM